METDVKILEVKELPLDSLTIGSAQVRLSDVGKEINELAASIRQVGLLEPIVVCPAEDKGKYEIIIGQRRFLAHREINAKTILAAVLNKRVDEITAKVLSVTENLVRRELNRTDLIDVCTYLYKKYGSVSAVIEKTGLPSTKVTEYVKYDRLVPALKVLVDKGESDIKVALRAQDAATTASGFNLEDALTLAKEMGNLSGAQQKIIISKRQEEPKKPIDEIIENAKTGEKITQIMVTLTANVHRSLKDFAKDEDTSMDVAAGSIIEESLEQKGFLKE